MSATNEICVGQVETVPSPDDALQLATSFEQLGFISQEEAAAQDGLAQYIGDRVLISCRDNPNSAAAREEVARLRSLSDSEYQVLHRRAYGWSYDTIAEDLELSTSTVRTHLGNIFEKICPRRHDSEEAVTFIPMDERTVYEFSFFKIGSDGSIKHKLTKAQQAICDLQIEGLSRQEIALKKTLSDSTVRTHLHDIYSTLGLSGDVFDRPGIVLRRLASASKNLIDYYSMIEKMAGGLQPKIVSLMQEPARQRLSQRTDRLLADPKTRLKLLRPLIVRGYVEPGSVYDDTLDLSSLIAAGLILDSGYQEVMLHAQTAPIAKVVIEKEVEYHRQNAANA